MKQKKLLYYAIIAVVFIIILAIYFSKSPALDEQTAQCIASKSTLYVSATCSHCAEQKEILGNQLDKFTLVDCIDNAQACANNSIRVVPTWMINNQKYEGVKSIDELKSLTGC